jgi:hypothetical protein
MTGKIGLKIDNSDHCCGFIALRKNDAYALIIFGKSFQRIARTACILQIAFIIIYGTPLHDVFHFFLRDVPAFHTATGVIAVLYESGTPVEPMVTVGL